MDDFWNFSTIVPYFILLISCWKTAFAPAAFFFHKIQAYFLLNVPISEGSKQSLQRLDKLTAADILTIPYIRSFFISPILPFLVLFRSYPDQIFFALSFLTLNYSLIKISLSQKKTKIIFSFGISLLLFLFWFYSLSIVQSILIFIHTFCISSVSSHLTSLFSLYQNPPTNLLSIESLYAALRSIYSRFSSFTIILNYYSDLICFLTLIALSFIHSLSSNQYWTIFFIVLIILTINSIFAIKKLIQFELLYLTCSKIQSKSFDNNNKRETQQLERKEQIQLIKPLGKCAFSLLAPEVCYFLCLACMYVEGDIQFFKPLLLSSLFSVTVLKLLFLITN